MSVPAQTVTQSTLQNRWKAFWISIPDASAHDYGVYLFRKTVNCPVKPATFTIHVSADNRYKLYVNEQLVSLGPARGDLQHWNFETVDIAAYLQAGNNIIAAQVWNDGDWKPEAQMSLRTGFILQGATAAEAAVHTNASWRCIRDSSYSPLRLSISTYYVAGPGERIDMRLHPKNWNRPEFLEQGWRNAQLLFPGEPKQIMGAYGTPGGWMLIPSAIPQMELKQERFERAAAATLALPEGFPAVSQKINIPAHSIATLVLDQGHLTNAYPTLIFSGGAAASVSLTYVEALYTQFPEKGNRNDISGKYFLGRKDSLISDGTTGQLFTPLAFRTYRYVQVRVMTQEEPLVLDDLYSTFTGYPFAFNATFHSDDGELDTMLETGWRTARLCAMETYMDCPYYEQLQYIGDTRIQGLVSLYNSGDDRLLKNALDLMDHSRQPEGVTLSRHPSFTPQYIPTFSLWYIGMLHDYMMYGKDTDFIRHKLPGMRQVLEYFKGYQLADGSLKDVPNWLFTDWVTAPEWESGAGPVGKDGTSALLDFQLLLAYQTAADLERNIGMPAYATVYESAARQLKTTIQNKYWDAKTMRFADRAEKDLFSQHANALAILTGMVPASQMASLAYNLLSDTTLAQASIYFKYYLHQALIQAGMGDQYLGWLDKWRENMRMGLTTWAEKSEVGDSRSDCHAWGASPNIEFFRTILGIDSAAPGFKTVTITPHPGKLLQAAGSIPHPNGPLEVSYELIKGKWLTTIVLPPNTDGYLAWKGKKWPLKTGKNTRILK